ncbi:hypothetical protein L873DRAFT_1826546 [Choiromyces venosus 120613-1]|uniref:DDE Tnp4 domain-containing protein n=1 Tax=Choiromyces venosus 120613-1 TaxID=1336337 RepID=A0A3N4K128_9PEZI|nr:hypothetical protein L873DRAFT_1826546 [Choiromyces venosus 120613-1]
MCILALFNPEEAFGILLYQMSYPHHLKDCIKVFGCSRTCLSVIFNDIVGFVDGTMQPFCRPGENKKTYYSGYKKTHAFKFQSIVTPDGLLSSLVGPFPGPIGDWMIWEASSIKETLCTIHDMNNVLKIDYLYVYRDSTYAPALSVLGPYAMNNFQNSLKVGLSPVVAYYIVATLLINSLLCLTGSSQVSEKYGLNPPSVEEYLYIE